MRDNFKRFRPYLEGNGRLLALALSFAFVSALSRLAIPFVAGKAINAVDAASGLIDLSPYLILMFSFLAAGTIFRYGFDYLTALVGQRVIKNLRQKLFASYIEAPIKRIDKSKKGDLVTRLVGDVENVQTGLVSGFAALFDGVVSILVTMVFMFTLNWILGLIVVLLTPISIFASRFISRFNSKHFKAQAKSAGYLTSFSLESLNNSETVKTLGIEDLREEEFAFLNDEYRKHAFKANLGASIVNPATRFVNAIINAALIAVGAVLLIKGDSLNLGLAFAVGDLGAFLTYASNYMAPFNEISNVTSEIDYAFSSFKRIDEAISATKDDEGGASIISGPIKDFTALNVDFSYDPSRKIIKDLSFEVKKGERVAFVGPTGSGKTTIINLLLRFYDPDSGTIALNSISSLDLRKKAYRAHLGMVLQDTWIFSGSVKDNIAYAKPEATDEEIIAAAKRAQADSFISRLPDGYSTLISDSSGLSVGEKQLLCVARVMLLEPEVVILDEATSNIDARTESLLAASFHSLMKGKTSFVVAHRLSTILDSDLILVLKDGVVVERGSHQELLAQKGFYYSLYEAQFA